jgi:hypothetical protein
MPRPKGTKKDDITSQKNIRNGVPVLNDVVELANVTVLSFC